MKNVARKWTKSESDSFKSEGNIDQKSSYSKDSHDKHIAQQGNHHVTQHVGHYATQHGGHHVTQHGSHPVTMHDVHHGAHQGSHNDRHQSGPHHKSEHSDLEPHDVHQHVTSASSHAFRSRRDAMPLKSHSRYHGSDRKSTYTAELDTPAILYENTYKLEPDCKFHEGKVRDIIKDVFNEHITENEYDPFVCGSKCKLLSDIIKERVKGLKFERFKLICLVVIGQNFDQSMIVTSRSIWNHKFDNFVSEEFKKGDIIAVGLVYALTID